MAEKTEMAEMAEKTEYSNVTSTISDIDQLNLYVNKLERQNNERREKEKYEDSEDIEDSKYIEETYGFSNRYSNTTADWSPESGGLFYLICSDGKQDKFLIANNLLSTRINNKVKDVQ